jgi:hypothetical protein
MMIKKPDIKQKIQQENSFGKDSRKDETGPYPGPGRQSP